MMSKEVENMKKQKYDYERACVLCEYGQEISQGEYCICKKKGIVLPGDSCSRFQFDPLKIKVSVSKIPEFRLILDSTDA